MARARRRPGGQRSLELDLRIAGFDPHREAAGYEFDAAEAARRIGFLETHLRHTKGPLAGQLITHEPWQHAFFANLFGWRDRRTGRRRFRKAGLFLPRKNGKSTMGAEVVLSMLFQDEEIGAELYGAAAERDQAALIFDIARKMVEFDPELRRHAQVYQRAITRQNLGTAYKVISAEASTKHGYNTHGCMFDELHAQKNRELWDVIETSMGARSEPLLCWASTAGYDRTSICYEEYQWACNVRDGIAQDPTYLPVIYEARQEEPWNDEDVWRKANPNLGVSVGLEWMRTAAKRAAESVQYLNTFRRLHLNQWTEQENRWLSIEKWDALRRAPKPEELQGRECYAALDLSSTTDLTAAAFAWLLPDNRVALRTLHWIPRETLGKRIRESNWPWEAWVRAGWVRTTDGPSVDYEQVRADFNDVGRAAGAYRVAIDRWNAWQMMGWLDADGWEVVEHGQGFASMSAPAKDFERLIVNADLREEKNPLLRWQVANAAAKQDPAGNVKPDKAKSGDRIDGVVAAIMAIGLCMRAAAEGSMYNDGRGLA